MSVEKTIVSHKSIVALATSLGITEPQKMKNDELTGAIKETLWCNCVRMAVYIRMLKEKKETKEKAVFTLNSFIKECPCGLTKAHKQYINELIFNLWVKKVAVPVRKETKKEAAPSSKLPVLPKLL